MKYSVGYQIRSKSDWIECIISEKEHVAEVYYAYPGIANGRATTSNPFGTVFESQLHMDREMRLIAQNGIPTNLLLNAMCYGAQSQERLFFQRIGDIVDYVRECYGTRSITTTSPLIARFIHENFKGILVRASVNMDIGSVRGMETLAEYFDGFYAKREYSRNAEQLTKMKEWCDITGHSLHLLANSGCMAECGMHVFHDNLVAHEDEIAQRDNAYEFRGGCWEILSKEDKKREYLKNATFIRPEDLHLYEKWFSVVKLATRTNRDPVRVLKSYISGHFVGSLPSLMEPNHEGVFFPYIIENSQIPSDFGEKILNCKGVCDSCHLCQLTYEQAQIKLSEVECLC